MRIRTIIDKEWAEVFKNKLVLMTVVALPLLFMVLPIFTLATGTGVSSSQMKNTPEAILQACTAQGLNDRESPQSYLVSPFMLFYLL